MTFDSTPGTVTTLRARGGETTRQADAARRDGFKGVQIVTSSGGLGYALGTVAVRIPTGRQLTTKYATIWQRAADGRWQLAVDSSSPNPA